MYVQCFSFDSSHELNKWKQNESGLFDESVNDLTCIASQILQYKLQQIFSL